MGDLGFGRIFDWIEAGWQKIWPFFIVDQYNKGVLLRNGMFRKVLEPGLHIKVPFIDSYLEHITVVTTHNLPSQSLTTKDEKSLVVRSVVKYQVVDIQTLILDVYDAIDAISDMTMAIIKRVIMDSTWEECKSNDLDNQITKKARVEAKKWGIEILQVTLTDIAQMRSFKLFNDTTHS